ncbi:MAG TPA: hypothetical protein PKD32_07555 [Saprospiraceae bacterium]|nr:hypothetical protein [Saprospiraceae bacterium]
MKKNFFLIAILAFCISDLMAQTGLPYQAILRNSSGAPQTNVQVLLKFEIIEYSTGTSLYTETQNPITDAYGWMNTLIGTGNPLSGSFSSVNWSTAKKLLVSCSDDNGATYNTFSNIIVDNSLYVGPKGDKGEKGDQGPKGDSGSQGAKGDRGDKGDQGDKGEKGEKGDAGTGVRIVGSVPNSSNLPLPYSGQIGDMYISQDNGHGHFWNGMAWIDVGEIKGPKGDSGSQGAKGDRGDKGDQGIQGLKGDKGDQGIQGIQGPKGDKGDKGDTGPAGSYSPGPGISIASNIITNTGDTDASNDIINTSLAGGAITGTFYDIKFKPETIGSSEIKDFSINNSDLNSMGANINQVLKFDGSKWQPGADVGLTLPYNVNYGAANPVAFSINSINNTTPLEVHQGGLVSNVPALRATSQGDKGIEVQSFSMDAKNTTARFYNENSDNAGSILRLENEGSGLALIAHSHSGSSAIIDGNTVKTNQVLDVFNLGTGRTMTVNQANPNSDQNTVTVSSATTAAVMSLESTRNGNQSPNSALLELKNGYIKIPQNNEFRTAFIHTSSFNNITGNATVLYYPNAKSTDLVFVQKSLPYTGSSVITWYDSAIGSWKISNEIINVNMPVGVTFFVFVIKTE